jgi:hypothetical protein
MSRGHDSSVCCVLVIDAQVGRDGHGCTQDVSSNLMVCRTYGRGRALDRTGSLPACRVVVVSYTEVKYERKPGIRPPSSVLPVVCPQAVCASFGFYLAIAPFAGMAFIYHFLLRQRSGTKAGPHGNVTCGSWSRQERMYAACCCCAVLCCAVQCRVMQGAVRCTGRREVPMRGLMQRASGAVRMRMRGRGGGVRCGRAASAFLCLRGERGGDMRWGNKRDAGGEQAARAAFCSARSEPQLAGRKRASIGGVLAGPVISPWSGCCAVYMTGERKGRGGSCGCDTHCHRVPAR